MRKKIHDCKMDYKVGDKRLMGAMLGQINFWVMLEDGLLYEVRDDIINFDFLSILIGREFIIRYRILRGISSIIMRIRCFSSEMYVFHISCLSQIATRKILAFFGPMYGRITVNHCTVRYGV